MIASSQWAGLELRHLITLDAVAKHRSFRKAAMRLNYTQSGISQQIAALERIVGERLIQRPGGSRPVGLTEAGRSSSATPKRSSTRSPPPRPTSPH